MFFQNIWDSANRLQFWLLHHLQRSLFFATNSKVKGTSWKLIKVYQRSFALPWFLKCSFEFLNFEHFLTLCVFKCDKCDFTFTWISHLERAVTWCLTPLYSNFNCWVKPNFIRNELKPLCQAELKDIELKRVRTDEQWRW